MAAISDHRDDPEQLVWDLEPIVDGEGDAGARRLLSEARSRADAFAATYTGRLATIDAAGLIAALKELAAIRDLLLRADGYAELRTAADSSDSDAAALKGATEAANAEVEAKLVFFELEWIGLEDGPADALLAAGAGDLDFAAHHLRRLRMRRPYLLDPAEERVLAETAVPRLMAWKRLYFESTGSLTVELDGETLALTEAHSRLHSSDRAVRRAAMAAIGDGLEVGLSTRVAAYNQVLGEKAIDDRLRGYPSWLSSRNLANETTDASVQAQLEAIAARRDIAQRWNRLKARLLGIDRLATCDIEAPLPSEAAGVPFSRTRDIILETWQAFSPRAGELLGPFFTDGRIDAPIRPNKLGGAFSHSLAPSQHPYLLINYGAKPVDTLILAHELGHGLHGELVRPRGVLQHRTSIPMIEVPSTFSEILVFERLLSEAEDDRRRLELLSAGLDTGMLNVFMTCAWSRAEAAIHQRRRDEGELSADELSAAFSSASEEIWGDTVEIERGMELWWSYVPHMIMEPGYLYAYSYGLLVAWSAYARYREIGQPFTDDYLSMLAAGGSRSPEELVAMIGLDLNSPGFWDAGLDLLEARLAEAEALAVRV